MPPGALGRRTASKQSFNPLKRQHYNISSDDTVDNSSSKKLFIAISDRTENSSYGRAHGSVLTSANDRGRRDPPPRRRNQDDHSRNPEDDDLLNDGDNDMLKVEDQNDLRRSGEDDIGNSSSNLFVTGIHPSLSEDEVTRLFENYGSVEQCNIMRDPHTKESRGFGFVKMVTADQAEAAKEGLQGELYHGRILSIEKARRAHPRTPKPGRYRPLAALPPEIREELPAQEAQERRRREREENRRQNNQKAPQAEDMDAASFLASLDPNLRAAILMDSDEDTLRQLPPEISAGARAYGGDRHLNQFNQYRYRRGDRRGQPDDAT